MQQELEELRAQLQRANAANAANANNINNNGANGTNGANGRQPENNVLVQPPQGPRPLLDYHIPKADDASGPIELPAFEGEPPHLNSSLLNMIAQQAFHGHTHENPHSHIF